MNFLFLDLETTGLDPQKNEIIEISAVRLGEKFEEIAVFDELIKSENKIPKNIEMLTGISFKMTKNSPKISEIRQKFSNFIKPDDLICGHNINFDIQFLRQKNFTLSPNSLDTFLLSQIFCPQIPSHSLEFLAHFFEISHRNAHRALSDVKTNIKIFKKFLEILQNFPDEIKEKIIVFLKKIPDIPEKRFFEMADLSSKKNNQQISIFDFSSPHKKENYDFSINDLEKGIAEKIINYFQSNSQNLDQKIFSLPTEVSETKIAIEVAEKISLNNFVTIAIPENFSKKIPPYFPKFFTGKSKFSVKKFDKFLSKKTFSRSESLAIMKVFGKIAQSGEKFFYQELSILTAEKIILEPIFKTSKNSQKKIICQFSTEEIPGDKIIFLSADKLEKNLEFLSREIIFSPSYFEFLQSFSDENSDSEEKKDFFESVFFGIGLLQKWISDKVPTSKFWENFIFSDVDFNDREIKNLANGFLESSKRAKNIFPENLATSQILEKMGNFLLSPENEEKRGATVFPDKNFLLFSIKNLPQQILQKICQNKKVAFLGKNFWSDLQQNKKIGPNFPKIEICEFPSEKNFKKTAIFVPNFGGNHKHSDIEDTTKVIAEFANFCPENILAILPNQNLMEKCVEKISKQNLKNWKIIIPQGKKEKISLQISDKNKKIIFITGSKINKIDFSKAKFSAAIFHRIAFLPPPDPIFFEKNNSWEISLSRALQNFRKIFFSAANSTSGKFFLVNLDAFFTKPDFSEIFLENLPEKTSIFRDNFKKVNEIAKNFLENN